MLSIMFNVIASLGCVVIEPDVNVMLGVPDVKILILQPPSKPVSCPFFNEAGSSDAISIFNSGNSAPGIMLVVTGVVSYSHALGVKAKDVTIAPSFLAITTIGSSPTICESLSGLLGSSGSSVGHVPEKFPLHN